MESGWSQIKKLSKNWDVDQISNVSNSLALEIFWAMQPYSIVLGDNSP